MCSICLIVWRGFCSLAQLTSSDRICSSISSKNHFVDSQPFSLLYPTQVKFTCPAKHTMVYTFWNFKLFLGIPMGILISQYTAEMKVATMYCSFSLHYSLLQLRILIPRAKASISFQKFRHIMSVFITHKFQLWGMNTWFVLFQQPINIYCINLLD